MAFSGGAGTAASTVKPVKLERESELRIEVGNDTPLRLRLVNGTELPPEVWLSFPPRLKFTVNLTSLHTFLFFKAKFRAFFTGYGATIELDRATETDYTADEPWLVM